MVISTSKERVEVYSLTQRPSDIESTLYTIIVYGYFRISKHPSQYKWIVLSESVDIRCPQIHSYADEYLLHRLSPFLIITLSFTIFVSSLWIVFSLISVNELYISFMLKSLFFLINFNMWRRRSPLFLLGAPPKETFWLLLL